MRKKIFFFHLGKTAGSSLNAFLKNHLNGEAHCEAYLASDGVVLSNVEHLRSLDYISGHLSWQSFIKNDFSKDEYFLVTFLRHPVSQLLSHVNWVTHIYDISSEFFCAHSVEVQEMSTRLREMNLHDPDEFIFALRTFNSHFQNRQSRFFETGANCDSDRIIENMLQLDLIGLTERYEESLELLVSLNWLDAEPKACRENQNPAYRVSKEILNNSKVYDFILEYNSKDIDVYNFFSNRFDSQYQKALQAAQQRIRTFQQEAEHHREVIRLSQAHIQDLEASLTHCQEAAVSAQAASQQLQVALAESQKSIHQLKAQLSQSAAITKELRGKLKQVKMRLQRSRTERQDLIREIEKIRSSRLWILQERWLKLKKFLALKNQ